MSNTKSKPLVIAMREAENALVACTNEIIRTSGLPCSIIEMIFDKVHGQLKDGVTVEFETAQRSMIEAERLEREAEIERAKLEENPEKEEDQNGS